MRKVWERGEDGGVGVEESLSFSCFFCKKLSMSQQVRHIFCVWQKNLQFVQIYSYREVIKFCSNGNIYCHGKKKKFYIYAIYWLM